MNETSPTPPPDPLNNRYAPLRADLEPERGGDLAARLAAVRRALEEDGWRLTGSDHDGEEGRARLSKCLAVAEALAIQALSLRVDYVRENAGQGAWHRFAVQEGDKRLVLLLADEFLGDSLREGQAGAYVETLIRDLRVAAAAGQALRVRTGTVERLALAPPDPAPAAGGTDGAA